LLSRLFLVEYSFKKLQKYEVNQSRNTSLVTQAFLFDHQIIVNLCLE
jgi:hypothetical protein